MSDKLVKKVLVSRGIYECVENIENDMNINLLGKKFYLIDQFDEFNLYKDCESGINIKIPKKYERCFVFSEVGQVWIAVNVNSMYYKMIMSKEVLDVE